MPYSVSSYYPPRAHERSIPRGLTVSFDRAVTRSRRLLKGIHIDASSLRIPPEQWLVALLVPGYAYALLGRRTLAWIMAAGWFTGLLLFAGFLGNPWITGWALGALASAHSSGLGFLALRERDQDPESPPLELSDRIWIPLGFWLGCLVLLYWPASQLFQKYVAVPVLLNEQIFIINPAANSATLTRGDWIAYRFESQSFDRVRVAAGNSLGLITGVPGDRIEFQSEVMKVNGRVQERRPEMPTSGELVVESKTRFIWPALGERIINVDRAEVNAAYYDLAQVPERNLIGRPYRHWFFRTQKMP